MRKAGIGVSVTIIAAALPVCGCEILGSGAKREGTSEVTAADFRAAAGAERAGGAPTAGDAAGGGITPEPLRFGEPMSIEEARGGVADVVVVSPGAPVVAAPAEGGSQTPVNEEAAYLLDRVVGRINGKPVFALEFLEPLDSRFRAEADIALAYPPGQEREAAIRAWEVGAAESIKRRLDEQVLDELLLAEFRTTLKPEQRAGLGYFIDQLREDIFLEYGGTTKTVDEALLAEGLTFEEKVKLESDKILLREQMRNAIADRIHVSRRDVEQYYRRNIDQFRADPRATLRVIRVPSDDAVAVAEVESRMAVGEPFADIALALSRWSTPDKTHSADVSPDGYEKTTVFGIAALNDAAVALAPGEVSPRLDVESSVYWLKLETMGRDHDVPLYEVQLAIEDAIRDARYEDGLTRYRESLLERSSTTSITLMIEDLLWFAKQKYIVLPSRAAGM